MNRLGDRDDVLSHGEVFVKGDTKIAESDNQQHFDAKDLC